MVRPYQFLLDSVSGLGKEYGGAHKQLSELLSLHECVSMLSKAKNFEELVEVFTFTALGEHPCRSAAVFVQDQGIWQQVFFKGASKTTLNMEALSALESHMVSRNIIVLETCEPPLQQIFCETGLNEMGFRRLVPLSSRGRLLGLLALGQPMIPTNLDLKDEWLLDLCDLFGVMLGSSLDKRSLSNVNRILEKRLFQLQTIREATDVFIRCYNDKSVFRALTQNLMGQFFISRSGFLITETKEVVFSMGCRPKDILAHFGSHDCLSTLKSLAPFKLTRLADNPRFAFALLLKTDEGREFCLLLGPRLNGSDIEPDDENLVISLARQASAALDNIALQEQRLENERMLKELELARSIQQKLLPKQEPEIPGYEVTAEMRPFKQVGGDFFDWFPIGDPIGDTQNWGFCLADVSGKSLPASMIMTTTQASLRALASYSNVSAIEIISRLNRQLCLATPSNRFVTMFFAVLDPQAHTLTYINAGHNPPFLFRKNDTIQTLTHGGMVLGMFASAPYKVGVIDFLPGNELLVYTDGISELVNGGDEEYGDERVAKWLEMNAGKPSLKQEKDALFEEAVRFSNNNLIDDMTVVMLRRNF